MAENKGPEDRLGKQGTLNGADASGDDSLERRRRDLGAQLASRRSDAQAEAEDAKSRGATGYGQAMKLSSEFISGVVVGAVLGWVVDHFAGTSPWGLIVFLLLGFGAGVLNVLRSAGLVAESGLRASDAPPADKDRK
ncbi:AtpZ/AtpI family protein [Tianweitania sp. BSSL-BM11]|uniref:ATP synthase protein I n=1 Tax=Tianweitania aestuarii TaxID=2814886 RepID=A0ABS5RTW5_9HYPH|nr:AtpZ/AtpI family protein [Tianweitania aestuarii]MBS9719731.1 AtpZ/AtpI family protein [Tianweitania aestuarii]